MLDCMAVLSELLSEESEKLKEEGWEFTRTGSNIMRRVCFMIDDLIETNGASGFSVQLKPETRDIVIEVLGTGFRLFPNAAHNELVGEADEIAVTTHDDFVKIQFGFSGILEKV